MTEDKRNDRDNRELVYVGVGQKAYYYNYLLHLSKSRCQRNDLQKSRIARDEAEVQSLLSTLEGWVEPFSEPWARPHFLLHRKNGP